HFVHLRYLHSFPTRRSSDLVIMPDWLPVRLTASQFFKAKAIAKSAILMRSPTVTNMSYSLLGGFGCTFLAKSIKLSVVPPMALTDRKSTRLNSSHSQISYAV